MPEPEDLKRLGARLDEARRHEAVKAQPAAASPLGIAFRFATEMVSALLVGGALGWGIDWLLGTRPVFLIVFFVLGAAAGIRLMIGAAKEINARAASASTAGAAEEDGED